MLALKLPFMRGTKIMLPTFGTHCSTFWASSACLSCMANKLSDSGAVNSHTSFICSCFHKLEIELHNRPACMNIPDATHSDWS